MIAKLKKYHLRLVAGLDELLVVLRGMSEEQRRFRPRDDAWSAIEVAHHVFLAESGTVASLEKHRGRPSRPRSLKAKLGRVAVAVVFRLGIPVKNPSRVATPDPDTRFEELEREWKSVRRRLLEYLESADEATPEQAGMRHPISGPLTVEETLHFLVSHLERHLCQVRRLRSAESFPTAAARG